MGWGFGFFFQSITLGTGLAMDAFSVSLANGLNDSKMRLGRMCGIAGIFAFFQALMPMLGWICVTTVANVFCAFSKYIPWIALILLCFIGGKMLFEGIQSARRSAEGEAPEASGRVGFAALLLQGVATSIDALSVGFTVSEHDFLHALICAAIIAAVTFIICMGGLYVGKTFGTRLSNAASILGGSILIFIGFWILIKSFL